MDDDKYALYQGSLFLGWVWHTEDDFPYHYGVFQAEATFEPLRPLFARELQLARLGDTDAWSEVRTEIDALGLVLKPAGRFDKVVTKSNIHIEGDTIWWR